MFERSRNVALGVLALGLLTPALLTSCGDKESGKQPSSARKVAKKQPKKEKLPALPELVQSAVESGNYVAAYQATLNELKGISDLKSPEYGRMSKVLEVLRVSSPEVLKAFADENPSHKAFLKDFLMDEAWQEIYLSCGLVPYHTPWGVKVLHDIWKDNDGVVSNKPLAVALASCWGGGETMQDSNVRKLDPALYNPVWRYNFFQKQQAKGALHPGFRNLKAWELRFVVCNVWQDWDDASLEWCSKHLNLPWDRYFIAHDAAVYTDPSKFGDNVQSGEFLMPFSFESKAETTQLNGGVCGSMSHLGCFAAMAHGIPAYCVGQPSHCAYGVRPKRGMWQGGFGGPDGDLQNSILGGKAPTSYMLMEDVFGEDDAVAEAYRKSWKARALEAAGDKDKAILAWKSVLKDSPMHPFFRKELHRLMLEKGLNANDCYEYLMKALDSYKKGRYYGVHGFAAADMMDDLKPVIEQMTDTQRVKLYTKLHGLIALTRSSWAVGCGDMLKSQAATLKGDAAKEDYLTNLLKAHLRGGGVTFGQVLEWAVAAYVEQGKTEAFGRAFARAAQSDVKMASMTPEQAEERKNKMKEAYSKALMAAEAARSPQAYKALCAAAKKVCPPADAPRISRPAELTGKPVPPNGLLRCSSTSQWDKPWTHLDVLTEKGGQTHTASEKAPEFVAQLDGNYLLSGCVIRKTNGAEERMRKATVYTSEDGATWMPKASTEDMPKEWTVVFPENTRARHVKITFDNSAGNNFAHISHFVVYRKDKEK